MAGRATLSFIGPEEVFLSGEPEVTYFIEKYQARTPFASRVDVVSFYENHANFGTEKICVKEYKSLGFAKRRAGRHSGASVVAIPATHTVDASGNIFDENDMKHQITEFQLI